jgi:hypothetical protein
MRFETEKQKGAIQRWSRLAIQLNGAAESGGYQHITPAVIHRELEAGQVFEFLERELPPQVWTISKLDDVDRHTLSQQWTILARAYEPRQFHVERNGLALLVAYVLHLIDTLHAVTPR